MTLWNTGKGVMLSLTEHGVRSDDLSHGTRGHTGPSVPTCCAKTVSVGEVMNKAEIRGKGITLKTSAGNHFLLALH